VNTHRNLNFVQLPKLVNDPSVDRRTRIIAWKSKNRSLKTPPLCVLFDHGKRMNRVKRDYSRRSNPCCRTGASSSTRSSSGSLGILAANPSGSSWGEQVSRRSSSRLLRRSRRPTRESRTAHRPSALRSCGSSSGGWRLSRPPSA